MHHHHDGTTPLQLLGVLTLFRWLHPEPKPEPPKPEPRPTPRDLGMEAEPKTMEELRDRLFVTREEQTCRHEEFLRNRAVRSQRETSSINGGTRFLPNGSR